MPVKKTRKNKKPKKQLKGEGVVSDFIGKLIFKYLIKPKGHLFNPANYI